MTVEKTKKRHGMIHSKTLISGPFPAFFFILVFSTVKLTTLNCSIKGANGWIRTWVLWHRKRPRCQLSHNNCTPPQKNTIDVVSFCPCQSELLALQVNMHTAEKVVLVERKNEKTISSKLETNT